MTAAKSQLPDCILRSVPALSAVFLIEAFAEVGAVESFKSIEGGGAGKMAAAVVNGIGGKGGCSHARRLIVDVRRRCGLGGSCAGSRSRAGEFHRRLA